LRLKEYLVLASSDYTPNNTWGFYLGVFAFQTILGFLAMNDCMFKKYSELFQSRVIKVQTMLAYIFTILVCLVDPKVN